jgi:hypothetical protein
LRVVGLTIQPLNRVPRGAANPCDPCNPCGAAESADITSADAETVHARPRGDMAAACGKAGLAQVQGYQQWTNVAAVRFLSATHGSRYVDNYANATALPAIASSKSF